LTISSIAGAGGVQQLGGGHRGAPRLPDAVLQAAAGTLGLDQDTVSSALRGGKTLADLAQEQGVSTDELTAAVAQAFAQSKAAGAPALSADRLTALAADVVTGRRPSGPPPAGPPPAGPAPASESDKDDDELTPLEQLAAELGVDSATLLDAFETLDLSGLTPSRWDEPGQTGGFVVDVQA
jgi:hypothetical protein